MWIATTIGFYSIVHKEHHDDPEGQKLFVIRARTRGDIDRLAKEIKNKLNKEIVIHEYEKSDYQFRIYLETKEDLAATLATLAEKVTYPNFKDEIAEIPHQQDKAPAYANLWLKLFLLTHKGLFDEQPSEA
jgi:hypothetical protein